ncbi:unnamed protein product [Mycena citricolor]|uniref:GATA-type domain-containing protein n=1 Tax=Mycena citricolor TaxID=2018698 RepID=A0AAD2JYP0_9AGAR|nr:unnamed protein product [Mycena citricolor]
MAHTDSSSSSFYAGHPTAQDSSLSPGVPTRCYWSLLSPNLDFIYLDPILAQHLGQQAQELLGKSLVTFVHPDEQSSAHQDLGNVLESRTLHGSVTRVRYSRLSRIRRELGYQGPVSSWSNADKIALDDNYIAVDIVINWAAEGVVLCFIHAVVDLTPKDNDESQKTDWSNWCGTDVLSEEQTDILFRRLIVCAPQLNKMNRVFQILSNEPNRSLLISWPPDQQQGPHGTDFARLVEDVNIGPGATSGNEAKTSCTRRFKALQTLPAVAGEVESIFIPHGSVIFACHKVNPPSRSTATSSANMQIAYNNTSFPAQSPYYEHHQGPSYGLPQGSASYNYLAPPPSSQPEPTPYSQAYGGSQWASSSTSNRTYPHGQTWPSQAPFLDNPSSGSPFHRSISPGYAYSGNPPEETGSEGVPAPKRRVSPGSGRDSTGSGRSGGTRPVGVVKCASCKATTSPEWRKGPSGKKELCNACGLRYARSRAKKEGNQAQRKRKEKGAPIKKDSPAPTNSSTPAYSAIRHMYDEGFEDSTSSPSPPAAGMNFVHYSPNDVRGRYQTGPSAIYSVPSPLATNSPVQSSSNPSYSGRVSPATHSPLSTAPSFERDRDRELAVPPAGRRTILTQQ